MIILTAVIPNHHRATRRIGGPHSLNTHHDHFWTCRPQRPSHTVRKNTRNTTSGVARDNFNSIGA